MTFSLPPARPWWSASLGALLATALLGACAPARGPTPTAALATAGVAPTTAPTATVSAPTAGTGPTVDIRQFAYSPAQLQVEPGTTVTWLNHDAIVHSITHDTPTAPGGAFDSGLFDQGQTFAVTLASPGTYGYVCTRHPFMRGEVIVALPPGQGPEGAHVHPM